MGRCLVGATGPPQDCFCNLKPSMLDSAKANYKHYNNLKLCARMLHVDLAYTMSYTMADM